MDRRVVDVLQVLTGIYQNSNLYSVATLNLKKGTVDHSLHFLVFPHL
jgi:hypothetical protein